MIKFVLLVNKQGQTRLSQYYEPVSIEDRVIREADIVRKCLSRGEDQVSAVNKHACNDVHDCDDVSLVTAWVRACVYACVFIVTQQHYSIDTPRFGVSMITGTRVLPKPVEQ